MNNMSPCGIECGKGALLLLGNYKVFFGNREVGKVQVSCQGLYYRFSCRCELTGDIICRLHVSCGGKRENLGVVVPVENGFGLDTILPVKKLGEGTLEFVLLPKHEAPVGQFVPIYPEEPFSYIARLKESFLEIKNGQLGISVKAGTES